MLFNSIKILLQPLREQVAKFSEQKRTKEKKIKTFYKEEIYWFNITKIEKKIQKFQKHDEIHEIIAIFFSNVLPFSMSSNQIISNKC